MNNLLSLILDTLIPASADGRMPGAGSLELADAVRAETAGATDVVAAGLAAAEERNFADLDDAGRTAVLREIESFRHWTTWANSRCLRSRPREFGIDTAASNRHPISGR